MTELLRLQDDLAPRSRTARFFGASPLGEESHAWYKGALGEVAVGRLLQGLGPEWTVLHAVPVGSGTSDIDHIVIGPGGVFTINTKNHSGQSVWVARQTLMVAGKKQRHIPNAVHEAARAASLLSKRVGGTVPVTGLLVIVDPKTMTIREKPEHVTVLTNNQLLRWLRTRNQIFSSDQVGRIAAVASLPDTWHRNPTDVENSVAVASRFAALHTLVGSAWRRRVGWWLLAGFAVFITAVIPSVSAAIF